MKVKVTMDYGMIGDKHCVEDLTNFLKWIEKNSDINSKVTIHGTVNT